MKFIFAENCFELVELGFSIFPLAGGSKVPVGGTRGVKDATKDLGVIRDWARRWPAANIGIATGEPSGVTVVDLDPRNGSDASVAKLSKQNKNLIPTIECRTPNGGRHLFYEYVGGIKNSSSKLSPGIDIKTTGGYVVAAPSTLIDPPKSYEWVIRPMGTSFQRLPKWAVQALTPPPAPKFKEKLGAVSGDIEPLVKWVAKSAKGDRNNSLYWASCRAGQAMKEGRVSKGDAFGSLLSAALSTGLPRDEAEKTITSGLNAGGGA